MVLLAVLVAGATRAAGDGGAIFTSPASPAAGGPLRVIAVSDQPLDAALTLVGPGGDERGRTRERHGGPPYWWFLEVTADASGAHRACLDVDGHPACIDVRVDRPGPPPSADGRVTRGWGRATEALYSAWIEKLFADPSTRSRAGPRCTR